MGEGGGSSPPSPYTPIILLHRCLQGVDTVVGSTGALCCKTPIIEKGTVGGQTALMCAAKGCSLGALRVLLAAGTKVDDADSDGRTALAYALALDKSESLDVAKALLEAGACQGGERGGGRGGGEAEGGGKVLFY